MSKTIPKKKKGKKAKWLSEEDLQTAMKRSERQRRNGKIYPFECRVPKNSKERCPLADEWIRKLWYIYTMEYYSAIKKNEVMSFSATWMNLEIIIISEVSQT